jgi:hypothetical protein
LFFSQVEFCDNLVFRRRSALDKLGERLLDANRTIGQPKKITMIFGRKITKHYRGKLQTEIEDMNLPNPVIRSHYGNGFIKQYVRDPLILRTESASNNVKDYGVNKSVENLSVLREKLSAINAASGHATAVPPRRLMNSRRRISAPKLRGQHCIGSSEYVDRAQPGIKTIAAVHIQCRRWVCVPKTQIRTYR